MEWKRKLVRIARLKVPCLFIAALVLASCGWTMDELKGSTENDGQPVVLDPKFRKTGADELAKVLGIEIVSLRITARGHMLDLRYRVVNPDAAKEVLRKSTKLDIRVVDQKTNHTLEITDTNLGKMRAKSQSPKKNRIYYVLFANPGAKIKAGSEVAIRFGPVQVNDLRVE